jgi:hypothetical protein
MTCAVISQSAKIKTHHRLTKKIQALACERRFNRRSKQIFAAVRAQPNHPKSKLAPKWFQIRGPHQPVAPTNRRSAKLPGARGLMRPSKQEHDSDISTPHEESTSRIRSTSNSRHKGRVYGSARRAHKQTWPDIKQYTHPAVQCHAAARQLQ